jgi:adenine-specific DNA-methyltransferase
MSLQLKDASLGRYYTTPLHAPGNVIKGSTGAAFKGINPPTGRHWRYPIDKLVELDNQGKIEWSENNVPRKKVYLHEKEGQKQQDIWYYKDLKSPIYPTQKNINIALDIIKSSSNYGDLVLDFFCGSGTTCRAAKDLGRHFIGIDNSPIAVKVAKKNLKIESET